ncbi:MAG: segregation/condensation protein A [Clostridia bacterium]|nr:segregation/condensation protein A [Clostridia bacterium]
MTDILTQNSEQSEGKLSFSLEIYEGPLDLLLALISKNKINIYDIPISLIFEQYMEYIERLTELDMEIAGEFLDMASRLMLIKSRMLLPKPANEEEAVDPRAELAEMLIEYQKAKRAAEGLGHLYSAFSGRFAKDTDDIPPCDDIPDNQDIELLVKAFERMALRKKLFEESRNDTVEASLSVILTREPAPVTEKINIVINKINISGHVPLDELFDGCTSRSELVATFLAILELMKSQKITADFSDGLDDPKLRLITPDDITDNPISDGGLPE